MEAALAARAQKVSVFAAASEGFSRRNTNGSIDEVLDRLAPVIRVAKASGVRVRGYLSCVIACPFDGPIEPRVVAACSARLLELGIDERREFAGRSGVAELEFDDWATDDGDVLSLESGELGRHVGRLDEIGHGEEGRAAAKER